MARPRTRRRDDRVERKPKKRVSILETHPNRPGIDLAELMAEPATEPILVA